MPKNLEISCLLDFYGEVLSPKQQEIMQQYYNEDLSLAEISENCGITRQGVRDAIKRAESILQDLEDKIQATKRFGQIEQDLHNLQQLTEQIACFNQQQQFPVKKIEECCQDILQIITKNLE